MKVANEQDKKKLIEFINSWTLEHPKWVRSSDEPPKRSVAQNALINKTYSLIGKQTENGAIYERCRLKLTFAVPIVLASERNDAVRFQDAWDSIYKHLDYEKQFQAMEFVQVSSLMSVKESSEYIDAIYVDSATNGIVLIKSGDYDIAMGR